MEPLAVFAKLKSILHSYEQDMDVRHNLADHYYLQTKKTGDFFGSAQVKKNYVAFHPMPVYCNPDLLQGISELLKKRMQGKSCFNFKNADEKLLKELKALTLSAYQDYIKEGKI